MQVERAGAAGEEPVLVVVVGVFGQELLPGHGRLVGPLGIVGRGHVHRVDQHVALLLDHALNPVGVGGQHLVGRRLGRQATDHRPALEPHAQPLQLGCDLLAVLGPDQGGVRIIISPHGQQCHDSILTPMTNLSNHSKHSRRCRAARRSAPQT
jgi:hypothetical protein